MGNSWEIKKLGDFVSLQRGHDLPSTKRIGGNIPIMGSFGITGYHNEFKVDGPGVTIGRSGGSMGVVNYIEKKYWPLNTVLYVTDFKENDPFFTYLLLSQIDFSAYNSGSAQPSLNRNFIYGINIKVPSLSIQKSIAKIIKELDDKIELNRQMNQTLEQMAQALFKSWFVDFDPVINNALQAGNEIPEPLQKRAQKRKALGEKRKPLPQNIQQLFPAEFELSDELDKWVPKGWKAGILGDIIIAQGGFAFKSKDFGETGEPVIKIKNIKSDGTVDMEDVQCFSGEITNKIERFSLHDGDVVMAMTGATVCKSGIIVNRKGISFLNQRVARFVNRKKETPGKWLSYILSNTPENLALLIDLAQGSAQPNISSKDIESLPIIIPSKSVLIKFDDIMSQYFSSIILNTKRNFTLTKLCNTLLPKLVSGKLRIHKEKAELNSNDE